MFKDPVRVHRHPLEERHMLETVARWGHNVLLVAMGILTLDIFLLR